MLLRCREEILRQLDKNGAVTSITRDSHGNFLLNTDRCSLEIRVKYVKGIPPDPVWTVGQATCDK